MVHPIVHLQSGLKYHLDEQSFLLFLHAVETVVTNLTSIRDKELEANREFTADDRLLLTYRKFMALAFETIQISKPLNGTAIVSMTDHIKLRE